jgi:hypothetical protein
MKYAKYNNVLIKCLLHSNSNLPLYFYFRLRRYEAKETGPFSSLVFLALGPRHCCNFRHYLTFLGCTRKFHTITTPIVSEKRGK